MIPSLLPALDLTDLAALFNVFQPVEAEFGKKIKTQFQVKHVFGFASCRAGLYHLFRANQVKNKKVLVSAYTCCVVTEAIVQSGNIPIFVDPAKNSFNTPITPELIKKHQADLGAIIFTNLFGQQDWPDPVFLKGKRNFLLILDDALSPGLITQRPKGLYDYILVSGSARKPFTSLGGGLIMTDSQSRQQILTDYLQQHPLKASSFKQLQKFILAILLIIGFQPAIYPLVAWLRRQTKIFNNFFNEKNHDIFTPLALYSQPLYPFQKRIGLNQLKKLPRLLQQRRLISQTYFNLLKQDFPWVKDYWRPKTAFSHLPFFHPQRDRLAKYLSLQGIETERYFDYFIPDLPTYKRFRSARFPRARKLSQQILNLPIYARLSSKSIEFIVRQIKNFNPELPTKVSPKKQRA